MTRMLCTVVSCLTSGIPKQNIHGFCLELFSGIHFMFDTVDAVSVVGVRALIRPVAPGILVYLFVDMNANVFSPK
jgi:hypothetical protein